MLIKAKQLIIQACTFALAPKTQSNLRFAIRVSSLPANSRKGIHNGRAGVSDTTFHTYASTALCLTSPPLLGRGSLWDTPGIFPTFSPETFQDHIFLIRSSIGMFFSLFERYFFKLSNDIRHALIQHWKIFLCYFSVSEPVVNFQMN